MMAAILNIFGFILATSFVGLSIIMAYDREKKLSRIETVGLSYLFGIGAITIEMFLLGLFGVKFTTPVILLPWVAVFVVNMLLFRYSKKKGTVPTLRVPAGQSPFFTRNDGMLFAITAALLAFVIAYAFFMALIKPMESYDAVAIWALKAKVIFLDRTISPGFFTAMGTKFQGAHPDYPLLLPLAEVWFYTFINNFNDHFVKVLFPLNFLAFLAVFYAFLKKALSNRLFAVIFTFILASIRQFSNYAANGYADMQMAIYASLTFLALYLWIKEKKQTYLWTAFFSCAFAIWTKNEGAVVFLGFILIAVIHIFTQIKNKKSGIIPIAALSILFISWVLFKASINVHNDVVNAGTFVKYDISGIFGRLGAILYEYQRQIFGVKYWNLIWIAFILLAVSGWKELFSEEYRYLTVPVFFILLCYTAIYFITPQDILWHLRTSASRLFIHFLPLAVFYAAIRINRICKDE